MSFFATLIATLFIVVCILLIVVVMLQKGRGGGLGAAFGGGAGGAFGTRTGDFFTWVTIGMTAAFLLLAIGTTIVYRQKGTCSPPRFTPPVQVGDGATFVSISTSTPGATIHFTTDGSEPTEQSADYVEDEPVSVEPGQTLRARAFRPGFKPSPIQSKLYGSPAELVPATLPSLAPPGE